MFQFNAVLICDRVYNRDCVNILSEDLEYTSTRYFEAIYDSLSKLCPKVYIYNEIEPFLDNISNHLDDVVFAAIWSGKKSRNRKSLIAAICEAHHIKYVGADTYVQTICQDKHLSQLYCNEYNIAVPSNVLVKQEADLVKVNFIKFPVIIKPTLEGGSMGISDENICYNLNEVINKYKFLSKHYFPLLVEKYIPGQEVAACIIGTPSKILHYEFVRLEINDKIYLDEEVWGFESKKCGKSKISRKVITNEINEQSKKDILEVFQSLGKVDYMRIDGRLNNDGKFYLIELTPDCSLHPDCFMFESFKYYGHAYTDMIYTILKTIDQ